MTKNDLKKLMEEAIDEIISELESVIPCIDEKLPLSGDEKYIKQQQSDVAVMPVNVSTATWREEIK